ncbi:hypothetical protein B484DRAFT_399474, partial [Ochromonadaceae sp. CCMP2298]
MGKSDQSEDGYESDMSLGELDAELKLPDLLRGISAQEKRELLGFKNAHTEREWEEEVLRRSDLLARRVDMERLQRMSGKVPVFPRDKGAKGKGKGREGKGKEGKEKGSGSEKEEEEDEDEEEVEPRGKSKRAAAKARVQTDSEGEDGGEEE